MPGMILRMWRQGAVVIFLLAVVLVLRFNTLGGRYGGFDNDHFAVLVRAQALAAGELPLRDYEDYELRGIRPALAYLPSVWAQWIAGTNLLAEALLCVIGLWLAAVFTFTAGHHLSRSLVSAASVALIQIVAGPKLYNWPKLLMPALFVFVLLAPMRDSVRAVTVGVVVAIAFLIRHDYAVYLAASWLALGVVRALQDAPRSAMRATIVAAVTALVLLAPGLTWAASRVGLVTYFTQSLVVADQEVERSGLSLPAPSLGASKVDWAEAALFYILWAIPTLAGVLAFRRATTPTMRAIVISLVVLAVSMNLAFLRRPLVQRIPDALVPACVLGAWIAADLWRRRRALARAAVIAVSLIAFGSGAVLNELATQVHAAGLVEAKILHRAQTVAAELRSLPEITTSAREAPPETVVDYLRNCTPADARVLVAGYHPEVYYLARRRFAGGVSVLFSRFYSDAAAQLRIIRRLGEQQVPVMVLPAGEAYVETFASDYPSIDAYVRAHYENRGGFGSGEDELRIWVSRGWGSTAPTASGLPCPAGATAGEDR
jgi:hypothetical protein